MIGSYLFHLWKRSKKTTFSEALRFNADYGVFEVINNAPQLLEKQLRKILQSQQPRNPIYDVVRRGKNDARPPAMSASLDKDTINVNYNIMCLSREQGIKWIKKERLPAFLESDCYFEYRPPILKQKIGLHWQRRVSKHQQPFHYTAERSHHLSLPFLRVLSLMMEFTPGRKRTHLIPRH
ncbi:regulator of G-protein signaling 22-like [Echinops telfairi]|uniref:Regulator of G-protein signaling 22-like n=1 Tax=Echinops telfairi TaxID=9371 RepID=A0AC55CUL7_ECHTE|nr:regulator of G-protein signaling 22-like [Echinops telfairi]